MLISGISILVLQHYAYFNRSQVELLNEKEGVEETVSDAVLNDIHSFSGNIQNSSNSELCLRREDDEEKIVIEEYDF